jgi:hypothetical protein
VSNIPTFFPLKNVPFLSSTMSDRSQLPTENPAAQVPNMFDVYLEMLTGTIIDHSSSDWQEVIRENYKNALNAQKPAPAKHIIAAVNAAREGETGQERDNDPGLEMLIAIIDCLSNVTEETRDDYMRAFRMYHGWALKDPKTRAPLGTILNRPGDKDVKQDPDLLAFSQDETANGNGANAESIFPAVHMARTGELVGA